MSILMLLTAGRIKTLVFVNASVALLLICTVPLRANAEAILKKGSLTCLNKESFDEFILAQQWKDQRGMDYLANAKQCVIIGDKRVQVSILPAPAGTKAPFVRLRAYYPNETENEIWTYQQNIIEASSADQDALTDGARLCTQQLPKSEKNYDIPTHLLAAIVTTESGRWSEEMGLRLPWPWTASINGQVHYFPTKQEAISYIETSQIDSSDVSVGCMQVNLRQFPKAFANLDDAFDPQHNVDYAASLLAAKFSEFGDWLKATSAFHSTDPNEQKEYLSKVEESWNSIVKKANGSRASKLVKSKSTEFKSSTSGCQFKTPDALLCSDAETAAAMYNEYGFNSALIRQSYTAQILTTERCITAASYKPVNYGTYKKEWKPIKLEMIGHGKVAEPDGLVGVHWLIITMDQSPKFPDAVTGNQFAYYAADGYIDGVCNKQVPNQRL